MNEDFTNLYKRWRGGEVRKEDKYNPLYVDFGESTTVLWSINNLVIDDKDKFNWDEIYDYNNDGWRLPTKEEVKELNWKSIRFFGVRKDDNHYYKVIKFIEGNELNILDDENPGSSGFGMWTSTPDKVFETAAIYYGISRSTNKFEMSTSGKFNKHYVFLVKDK